MVRRWVGARSQRGVSGGLMRGNDIIDLHGHIGDDARQPRQPGLSPPCTAGARPAGGAARLPGRRRSAGDRSVHPRAVARSRRADNSLRSMSSFSTGSASLPCRPLVPPWLFAESDFGQVTTAVLSQPRSLAALGRGRGRPSCLLSSVSTRCAGSRGGSVPA